jgi:hypothetical protein
MRLLKQVHTKSVFDLCQTMIYSSVSQNFSDKLI